ncbi:MAG: hypothetical protein ACLR0N_12155 [Bilophila wadsworthia]
MEAVKAELDGNPRLAMDFPAETGRGRVWNVGTILTAQNVKLKLSARASVCAACVMAHTARTL